MRDATPRVRGCQSAASLCASEPPPGSWGMFHGRTGDAVFRHSKHAFEPLASVSNLLSEDRGSRECLTRALWSGAFVVIFPVRRDLSRKWRPEMEFGRWRKGRAAGGGEEESGGCETPQRRFATCTCQGVLAGRVNLSEISLLPFLPNHSPGLNHFPSSLSSLTHSSSPREPSRALVARDRAFADLISLSRPQFRHP